MVRISDKVSRLINVLWQVDDPEDKAGPSTQDTEEAGVETDAAAVLRAGDQADGEQREDYLQSNVLLVQNQGENILK